MPWLNREIIWLLSNTEHYITMVLRTLEDLLLTYDMTSVSFRRRIQTYFHRYTSHFIHELINYARSPYDLMGYDRNVQYYPYFEDEVQSIGSSDDESLMRLSNSDSESSNDVTETRTTIQQRLNNSSLIVYNNSINVNNVDSISGNGGSGVAASGSGESSRALGAIVDRLAAHTSRPIESVELESDDSDEIMFVGEQKPPHLRTPEMVELNSESDSDVMFVEDENPNPRTETESIRTSRPSGSSSAVENRCDKRKASRDLNSTSSLTLAKRKYEVNKKESDRDTSPSSPATSTPSSASSMSSFLSSSSSSTVTSSSTTSSSSSSFSSMTPSSSSAASTSSNSVIKTEKPEYNSMENDSRRYHSVIKRYARPKRRHTSKKHSKRRAAKTIYDPDTSNSDASDYDDDDGDNSNDSYVNSSRSSSSESSHEEFTVGRASSSRKKSKSSRKKMDRKKKRKSKRKSISSSASSAASATLAKPKRKITKLCIKREKNANYRLVDKYYDDDDNDNDDDDDDHDDGAESTRHSFSKSRHQHHHQHRLADQEDDD